MQTRRVSNWRVLAIAVFALLAAQAPGCKREAEKVSPPVGAAPAPAAGPAGLPGAATSAGTVVVEAADLPAPTAGPLRVVFGERGAGVAYVATRSDGIHVVHEGRAGRALRAVDQIALSPDGRRIAVGAEVDGIWRMIVDGELDVMSSAVEAPAFSPDSRHIAYAVDGKEGKRLVVDRKEGPKRFGFVGTPVFSAHSTLVAFAEVTAENEPARFVVSDLAQVKQRVVCAGVSHFVANPEGTRLAAVSDEGKGKRLVLTGFGLKGDVERGRRYDAISNVAFSPDGATVAYVAEQAGKRLLVMDGKEMPLQHAAAADLAYGGGVLHAYAAQDGERWRIVANGNEGPPYDRVVTPSFSPDGRLLVYRARKDGKRFVVVADASGKTIREHPAYEQVFPVQFAADGRSITYGVKDGNRLMWKVEPL